MISQTNYITERIDRELLTRFKNAHGMKNPIRNSS